LNSQHDNQPMSVLAGRSEVQVQMPYCGLKAGAYSAKILVGQSYLYLLDVVESFRFRVRSGSSSVDQSMFYQPRSWRVTSAQPAWREPVD
jgi:lipopolysaccharide transport system ATP-binding protein